MKIISYLLKNSCSIMGHDSWLARREFQYLWQRKKRYCEMIKKGASRSTVSEFYRKKHGEELSERTWRSWKADCKSICELKSNSKFYQSHKKSTSMQQFEEKIKEEYQKRRIKLKKRGVTSFIRSIQSDFFPNNDEIKRLQISTRFVTRIVRDCGRTTSKKTDRVYLSDEQQILLCSPK